MFAEVNRNPSLQALIVAPQLSGKKKTALPLSCWCSVRREPSAPEKKRVPLRNCGTVDELVRAAVLSYLPKQV